MFESLAEFIHDQIESIDPPQKNLIEEDDLLRFSEAKSHLKIYSGDPDVLVETVEMMSEIQCRPLFYAMATAVIHKASFLSGSYYEPEGMEISEAYLQYTNDFAETFPEVASIHAQHLMNLGEFDAASIYIRELAKKFPNDFDINIQNLHIAKHGSRREVERAKEHLAKNIDMDTEQSLEFLRQMASIYLSRGDWENAIEMYEDLSEIKPDHAWTWHNLSIAYMENKNTFKARKANQKALSLMEFGAAIEIEKKIRGQIIFGCAMIALWIFFLIGGAFFRG